MTTQHLTAEELAAVVGAHPHLTSCAQCREQYHRLSQMERQLSGDLDTPAPAASERMLTQVFEGLDAESSLPNEVVGHVTSWWRRLMVPGVLAAVSVAAIFIVPQVWPVGETFTPKGAGVLSPATGPSFPLALFCVDDTASPRKLSPDQTGALRCGDQLVLAVGPLDTATPVAHVFVRGGHGDVLPALDHDDTAPRKPAAAVPDTGFSVDARSQTVLPVTFDLRPLAGEHLTVDVVICAGCTRDVAEADGTSTATTPGVRRAHRALVAAP